MKRLFELIRNAPEIPGGGGVQPVQQPVAQPTAAPVAQPYVPGQQIPAPAQPTYQPVTQNGYVAYPPNFTQQQVPAQQAWPFGAPQQQPAPEPAFEEIASDAITLPEGMEANNDLMGEFTTIYNNPKLSRTEMAQSLFDLHVKAQQQASEAGSQQFVQTQQEWRATVEADPEIGGEKLDTTLANIGRLTEKYGNDAAREAFTKTGAGNHPEVMRMLNAIAADVLEPLPVDPAPGSGQTPKTPQDVAASLYPTMATQQ